MMRRIKSKSIHHGTLMLAFVLTISAALTGCGRSDAAAAEEALQAQSLLEQRRLGEARLAINDAIAMRDDEPQFHILRGRIEMAAGSLPGAYDAYSNAMSLDPANVEALQAVSQLGLQTGNLRESLEATDAILSLTPDDPQALLMRGLHAVIRSRFAEADGYADKILSRDPNNEGGVVLKARVAVRKGEPASALRVLAAYGVSKPETLGVVMTRLEIYRVLRDAPGMRSQFALLRTLAADNRDVQLDEANFAFKDGRPQDGAKLITALLADPKLPEKQLPAIVAVMREYAPDGLDDRNLARVGETGTKPARLAMAELLVDRAKLARARVLLGGLDGQDLHAVEAGIAARENRWSDAIALTDQVLDEDKTHCLALTVQAEARLQKNDLARALTSAQLAVNQCPGQEQAWELAARIYERRDDLENARRMWRQGLRANSQNPNLTKAYVDWLLRAGQEREALAASRRLTRAAPALLSGWRLYNDVCTRLRQACTSEARTGLADAATLYGVDLLPGQAPPNGLFGRIVTR